MRATVTQKPLIMKKFIKPFLAILLITGVLFVGYFSYNETKLQASLIGNTGDYVVLVHGLGRTNWSMQKIGLNLASEGYRVINLDYPTRTNTIENLVASHLKKEIEKHSSEKEKSIHFVTHSMGGIMTRYYLANHKPENLGKVVMLAPPNQGSRAADLWLQNVRTEHILGPALKQMSTQEDSLVNNLPAPDYPLAIIAGKWDGKVSVEQTRLEGMSEHLITDTNHSFILQNQEVIDEIIGFLENDTFK